jgi:transcriptional regulator with XRE-family HTH domain
MSSQPLFLIGEIIMSTFHERLRSLRESRKIPVSAMLELLQMTRRNYQRYERGEVDPPSSKLVLLANYFGVSTDYLLGRTDTP